VAFARPPPANREVGHPKGIASEVLPSKLTKIYLSSVIVLTERLRMARNIARSNNQPSSPDGCC